MIVIAADDSSLTSVNAANADHRLLAHGQANITITNATPFGMEINNVGIRKVTRVETLNGASITLDVGTTYFNKHALSEPSAGGDSVINITQDAYATSVYGINGSLGNLRSPSGPQDLYVRGKIVNADGVLNLTNMEGSINVTGEVRAGSVNISAAGDFNLSTEDWLHTGADPRQFLDFNKVFGASVYNADGIRGTKTFNLANTADSHIAALLAATTGGAVAQTKEEEGNSTRASADVLTTNVAITAKLQNKFDQDFFKLTVADAGQVTVAFDAGSTNLFTPLYYEISLMDSTGKVLNTVQTGFNKTYYFNVTSGGDYYLRVSAVRTYPATNADTPATTPNYKYTVSDGKKTVYAGDTVLVGDKIYVYDDSKGNPVEGKPREVDLSDTDQFVDKDYWWQVNYNYRGDNYAIKAVFTPPAKDAIKTIFAMGEINIVARYLNIDGTIQSGVDNITLNISKDFEPGHSTNFTDPLGNIVKGIDFGSSTHLTVDGYFDANTGTIRAANIHAHIHANMYANRYADTDTNMYANRYANTDTDMYAHRYADTDTNMYANRYADSDTNVYAH